MNKAHFLFITIIIMLRTERLCFLCVSELVHSSHSFITKITHLKAALVAMQGTCCERLWYDTESSQDTHDKYTTQSHKLFKKTIFLLFS